MLLKNNIIKLLCIIGFMNYGYCQDLIPYKVNNKWGYADGTGKMVYNAIYDSVGVFKWNNTLKKYGSMVYKKDKSIYINKENLPIFNAKYKDVILDYNDWIIASDSTGKLKLFDTSVMEFSNFTFDTFDTFEAKSNFLIVENKGKIGVINKKSEIIIPTEYDQIYYHIFYNCSISSEDYEAYQLKDFEFERKNDTSYIDGIALSDDKDMILATVINNKETKRIIKFVNDKENENSNGNDEESENSNGNDEVIIQSLSMYNEGDDQRLKALSEKKGLNFIECDSEYNACIFKKDDEYGIYNLKTGTSSEMFDKVALIEPYGLFKVTKEREYGLFNTVLEELMPVKYSHFSIDYNSNYIVTASTYDSSTNESIYDYYNIKTKKYIIKNCDFLYGDYVNKSSKKGIYFFPVKKNESIFYVNENGIKYIQ
jgi:hypothetical protein